MIHFICALKCEALPLIEHFKLKHKSNAHLFNIYLNEEVSLTVSGVGKLAAVAACTYSYSILDCKDHDIWLNVGIAGHTSFSIGEVYLANRVEDESSSQVWYPQIITEPGMPTANLLTLEKESTEYGSAMFDMEASGVMSATSRFTTVEFVHSVKIISDNQSSSISDISAKKVSLLIEKSKSNIIHLANQLKELADELLSEIDISEEFNLFIQTWHFSQYQKIKLEKTLHRWSILTPGINAIESIKGELNNATAILQSLNQSLDNAPLHFGNKTDV